MPAQPATNSIFRHSIGIPRSVNTSHSGNVDIAIGLQEPVVFLPANRGGNLFGRRRPANRGGSASHRASPPPQQPVSGDSSGGHLRSPPSDEDLPTFEESTSASSSSGAVLRGSVVLKLSKPTRIKQLSLVLYTVSRTVWTLVPQPTVLVDAPLPTAAELEDVVYLAQHYWDFVPSEAVKRNHQESMAKFDQSASTVIQDQYGANTAILRNEPTNVRQSKTNRVIHSSKTSLQNGLPLFAPLEEPVRKVRYPPVASDSVLYPAGEYVFHFGIIMDSSCPETSNVPNGHVKHFLAARVVRAGAFNPNVTGKLEIEVCRAPPAAAEDPSSSHGVVLSRVWDERLVYSVSLDQRYVVLNEPVRLSISLLPMPGLDVMVHQIRVYALESVSYLFSTDYSIHTNDHSLRLGLVQISAPTQNLNEDSPPSASRMGTLLHPTEPTHIQCDLVMATDSDRPIHALPQAYGRGRNGEKRFLEPDMVSPYVKIKHRLIVGLRVSRYDEGDEKRSHFEVKIDTPFVLLSRHCVQESINLPGYDSGSTDAQEDTPPTFDQALNHEIVGSPCKFVGDKDGSAEQSLSAVAAAATATAAATASATVGSEASSNQSSDYDGTSVVQRVNSNVYDQPA
ncbi:Putative arrestin-related trafficking adapter C2D10.04 [Wickerhamiella sorbophila]|uniref:Arrestin-related trafficking adapter C2D10.04 n=1 Tax=Wickerhamiella sorbophila TaxID=45607 RepID=A0A2T0FCR5_9ASCO|nr:Putative arrestin-related trafficking adapter C2D10.04 [Wickerhamiella sorbophila]PRT52794.1 Putative arrestin-related trafficking adapter C2D10.04 [Wickerhamiella sorbophila]